MIKGKKRSIYIDHEIDKKIIEFTKQQNISVSFYITTLIKADLNIT